MTQNLDEIKETMLKDLNKSLSVVNDIDIKESVENFCEKGWYDMKKSYKDNLNSCIQYIAIKKSKKSH